MSWNIGSISSDFLESHKWRILTFLASNVFSKISKFLWDKIFYIKLIMLGKTPLSPALSVASKLDWIVSFVKILWMFFVGLNNRHVCADLDFVRNFFKKKVNWSRKLKVPNLVYNYLFFPNRGRLCSDIQPNTILLQMFSRGLFHHIKHG